MKDFFSTQLWENIEAAASFLARSKFTYVFTGAGVSVESGIPPFRGPDGIWSRYDMGILDIREFYSHPEKSWPVIKEIFYDFWGKAKPNPAHYAIAELEKLGIVKAITTQNIDGLHQEAGSDPKIVYEYHGTLKTLRCMKCGETVHYTPDIFKNMPPICPKEGCGGILKPDFVFFGEPIPEWASHKSIAAAMKADVMLIIGTTGEIMPASTIPYMAAQGDCTIIEVNPNKSQFTDTITDIFLQGKAGVVLPEVVKRVKEIRSLT